MRLLFISLFFITAIKTFSQNNTPEYLWRKANNLPSSENEKKLELYQKAASLAKKQKNFVWETNIIPDICGSYYNLGDFDNATKVCIEGLKIFSEKHIAVDSISFKLHSSLATCYNKTYRIGQALSEFEIANQILNKKPIVAKQSALFAAFHYSNQAHLLLDLFEIENAKVYYEKALQISSGLPSKKYYAIILSNLSQYYRFLGEYKKGIEKLEEAFRNIHTKNDLDALTISNMYFMLGSFYQETRDFKLAKLNFEKSIIYAKKEKATLENVSKAIVSQANLYLEQGESLRALHLLKSIKPERLTDKENAFEYYLTHGNIYTKQNQLNVANQYYEKAFKACFPDKNILTIKPKEIFEYKFRLYEILSKLSKNYELKYTQEKDLANLATSYSLKKKSILVGKNIRAFQENLESKLFFTDRYHKHYTEAIVLGYKLYEAKPSKQLKVELFNLAEESKSISLNDNLLLNNQKRDNKTDSLMAKYNAYQSYLSYLKNNTPDDKTQIIEYELKTNNLIKQIRLSNTSLLSSIFEEKDFSKYSVPQNSLYLNYILVGSQVLVFSKNFSEIKIKTIAINSEQFKNIVQSLSLALVSKPHPIEGFAEQGKCEYLFNKLMKPLKYELLEVNRLIINPDNSFYGISFDILQNPENQKYLIESHAISYANNMEHAFNSSTLKKNFSKKWDSFFPFSSSTQNLISGLKPLKFSLKEIKGIIADVKKDKGANKGAFLESLTKKDNNVVMIATHAKGNDSDPYLLFDEKNTVSSRLYASEMRFSKVTSPMVVLSACETNKGKTFNGLGVLSFAKTLSWAGCPSVVGTFWDVDDKSMGALASIFYRNLMMGMEKDLALQNAKLTYLQTSVGKQNDLPFYWAHLQIMGDTSPIATNNNMYFWIILVIILTAFTIYYFRKRLKRFFSARVAF